MSFNIENTGDFGDFEQMPDISSSTLPQTEPVARWTFWRWSDVLLMAGASLIIMVTGLFTIRAVLDLVFGVNTSRSSAVPLSISMFVLEFVALVGSVYLLGMRPRHLSWSMVGLRRLSLRWGLVASGLSLLMLPVGALAIYLLAFLLDLPLTNVQLPVLTPRGLSWTMVVVLIVLGGVIIPFAEELFFRGVLYIFLRERWGAWTGALISSLIFAAIHFDVLVAAMAFCLGLFCCFSYERSKSLWAPFIVHAISNTIKLIIIYWVFATSMKIPLF